MEEPIVVNASRQDFDGTKYYLCGRYYQRDGVRLHRVVWEKKNGRKIPKGFDVHHDDGIRAHNYSSNLVLLSKTEHGRVHGGDNTTERQRKARRKNVAAAKAGNAKITAEERAKASRKGWETQEPSDAVCSVCTTSFKTFKIYRDATVPRFCKPACYQRALRKRKKGNGLPAALV